MCHHGAHASTKTGTFFALARRSRIPWVWWLVVFAVWVPPTYAIVRHSNLYNGLRHFLFIIPPIAGFVASSVINEQGADHHSTITRVRAE